MSKALAHIFGMALVAVSAAACAQGPDIVLVNRSGATLAFAPGVIVAPCTSAAFQATTLRAAGDDLVERLSNLDENDDENWIPADAVFVDGGVPGARKDAPKPMVVVISGARGPYEEYGSIREETLPACGGDPQGINSRLIPN
jgi:hypothetical protein